MLNDQRGMVGKLAVVWLLLFALFMVAAVDTVSIVSTRLHLSTIATNAASDGVAAWRTNRNANQACQIAELTVHSEDPSIKLGRRWCVVTPAGTITVTLHKPAKTLLAGRLDATKKYATVTDSETSSPGGV
jgi:uncharacterized membrane protein